MVRVGVDENLAPELLLDVPSEAQIVRIPRQPAGEIDIDFWLLASRKDAYQIFTHLRGVQVIQCMMAGVDWITPWLPKGITLCDGRGIHDISTSEWTVTAILSSLKRFPLYRDLQQRHEWGKKASAYDTFLSESGPHAGLYSVLGEDLAGKTVLIIGYGSIGAAIEARLSPFGVTILRVARTAKTSPHVDSIDHLHRLLPQADVIVTIVPLTPMTHGLISAREFALMKKGALFVNSARGPVVDTNALLEALNANRIRAALDVTDPEPLPPDHPLWSAPNCLITPHVAGSTPEFIYRAFRFGAAQLRRFIAGQPLENIVSSEVGY